MKAKDLAKLLLEYPDFEVEASILVKDNSEYGIHLDSYKINGISDIGHSDHVIILDLEEK